MLMQVVWMTVVALTGLVQLSVHYC